MTAVKIDITEIRGPKGPKGAKGDQGVDSNAAVYNTTLSTSVGDLVKVAGNNLVQKVTSNNVLEVPRGIFGYVVAKPTTTTAEVLFAGPVSGLSGLISGKMLRLQPDGSIGQGLTTTGISQNLGFATSTTTFVLNIGQPFKRI